MHIAIEEREEAARRSDDVPANGAAIAAFVAAGIGSFAMGLFVLLNEADIFAAPSLYGPAGGVSGRTTFAAATWLLAWAILHHRWRGRSLEPRRAFTLTLLLIVVSLVATFPPVWTLL